MTLLSLTSLVLGSGGPGLSEVKVRVSPNAVTREVCMSQEATLAIERRAVAVESLGEREHNVGVLLDLAFDLAVGDLSEAERDRALPHTESLSDGFEGPAFTHFRCEVLDAVMKRKSI